MKRVLSPMPIGGGGWHAGQMPAADAVLLPLAVGLTLLGLLVIIVAWRGGRRGRALQGLALALAPVALYFSGLLRLVWDAVVAVVGWASRIVFSPPVWLGLSLLALSVVLWVVGGVVARRSTRRGKESDPTAGKVAGGSGKAAPATGRGTAVLPRSSSASRSSNKPPVDDDMAEIEALLKSRGIE